MCLIENQFLCVFNIKLSFLLFVFCSYSNLTCEKAYSKDWFYAQVVQWQWTTWFCKRGVFWNFYYYS